MDIADAKVISDSFKLAFFVVCDCCEEDVDVVAVVEDEEAWDRASSSFVWLGVVAVEDEREELFPTLYGIRFILPSTVRSVFQWSCVSDVRLGAGLRLISDGPAWWTSGLRMGVVVVFAEVDGWTVVGSVFVQCNCTVVTK